MRYIVYGAGAVGGVQGARLHLAGLHTTLVARGPHLDAIRARGLLLESPSARQLIPVPAVGGAGELAWSPDTVVLLCVKSQQTHAALDDLAEHAPANTPVVTSQNGVANEAMALRRFARVHGMCVMQPSSHVEPGVVVQQCEPVPGILDLGRYPAGADDLDEAVATDLRAAGFVSEPRPDIMAWKYRKLIMNLGNGIQACFQPGPAARELQTRARAEGEAVLAAAGIPVVDAEQDNARRGDILQGRTRPDHGGSTWQSVARGDDTVETDWLNGEIVLLGRQCGIPTPVNGLLQHATGRVAREGLAPRSLDAAAALIEVDDRTADR